MTDAIEPAKPLHINMKQFAGTVALVPPRWRWRIDPREPVQINAPTHT